MKKQLSLDEIRSQIKPLLAKHGVVSAAIFGSYARGEATKDSDLDLLITLKPRATLFDLIGLKQDLEDLLGIRVDVVTERSLSRRLRPYVEPDKVPV